MPDSTLPPILVNGRPRPWRAGLTVALLVQELGLPEAGVAVEQNGQVVRRAAHGQTQLQPGDRVELVRLVGGG